MEVKLFNGRPTDDENIRRTDAEREVYELLDKVGVEYKTLTHPAAYTMEECESVRQAIGAPVFKNLFLTNKQQTQFYLLMIPAGKPFKTKYLSSQLGCARLSFATAESMLEMLNVSPGAVTPLGLIHDKKGVVRLIIDEDLLSCEKYACHPCVNTASVCLNLKDLLEIVIPATGHNYTPVRLPTE